MLNCPTNNTTKKDEEWNASLALSNSADKDGDNDR